LKFVTALSRLEVPLKFSSSGEAVVASLGPEDGARGTVVAGDGAEFE
jgi:hypothetical protein